MGDDRTNRIAMVTGAGSGIGRATTTELVARGWHVVLVGRRLSALEDTVAGLGAGAERTWCRPTDVTDAAQVDGLFADLRSRFGRLDLLFNNAGANLPAATPDQVSAEQWRAIVEVNLTGAFLCTRAAFALMRSQVPHGGRIVNNGSISAHVPRPGSIAYTATKHAITGLTRSTSLDGRPFDIACGQIDIGNASTDMTRSMGDGVLQADGSRRSEPTFPVEHVARAVAFMADLPLQANVPFLTVMANGMPYMGRG